jgi:Zn-dependent protease
MTGWWVHDLWNAGRGGELVSWIFWVIASITLHELAHGWVAIWEGDDTPKRMGRMTANPVVHMGVPSLVVFLIIGIAWGLMPVNPYKFRHGKWGRIYVAAAGPAMNLLLAFLTLTAYGWIMSTEGKIEAPEILMIFLFTGGYLNILLAVFNLLPIPPLDGSVILSNLSPPVQRLYAHPQAGFIGLFFMLALFMSDLGSLLFGGIQTIAMLYAGIVYFALGGA